MHGIKKYDFWKNYCGAKVSLAPCCGVPVLKAIFSMSFLLLTSSFWKQAIKFSNSFSHGIDYIDFQGFWINRTTFISICSSRWLKKLFQKFNEVRLGKKVLPWSRIESTIIKWHYREIFSTKMKLFNSFCFFNLFYHLKMLRLKD